MGVKPKRRFKNRTRLFCTGVALVLCGTVLLLFAAHAFLRRMLNEYPMSNGCELLLNTMNTAMQSVLKEQPVSVDEVDYAPDGSVRAVKSNAVAINKVKVDFLARLQSEIAKNGQELSVSVPLGTLLGSEYTLGMGPQVRFKVQFSTTFNAALKSEFLNAGVNNTLHRISLTVSGVIYILIPWSRCEKTVTTDYVLSETVIAGAVPEAYTQVFDESGEVIDDIFNYASER